jgi:hypothetical protein
MRSTAGTSIALGTRPKAEPAGLVRGDPGPTRSSFLDQGQRQLDGAHRRVEA